MTHDLLGLVDTAFGPRGGTAQVWSHPHPQCPPSIKARCGCRQSGDGWTVVNFKHYHYFLSGSRDHTHSWGRSSSVAKWRLHVQKQSISNTSNRGRHLVGYYGKQNSVLGGTICVWLKGLFCHSYAAQSDHPDGRCLPIHFWLSHRKPSQNALERKAELVWNGSL